MKISIVGLSEVRARLNELRSRVGNLRPALLRAAIEVLDTAKMRIRSGGDPPWPPTKPPSNLHPPLIKTGTLFRSFSDGDAVTDIPMGLRVGTNLFYAPFQQFGTRTIPSRPFLPDLSSDDELRDRIKRTIADFIARGE
jgi:phage gpG-like protein